MASVTDRQWKKWAEHNPYYGILGFDTAAIQQGGNLEAFQRSGEEHVAHTLDNVARLFPGWKPKGVALDFGCGAARLSLPLANYFEKVIGVDVAENMLVLARKHAKETSNVSFVRTIAQAAEIDGGFDFLNSSIVLQHIRPAQGLELIGQMVQLLRPGGAFALHVLLADTRMARRILNYARYRLPPLHWAYNLSKGRPWNEPITEMNPYPIWKLLRLFADSVPEVVMSPFNQGGYGGCIVHGRKPG